MVCIDEISRTEKTKLQDPSVTNRFDTLRFRSLARGQPQLDMAS